MKQLLFVLLFLPFGALSQLQQIEVCTENQEYLQDYWVDAGVPSQYDWVVQGGEIINGQGTETITVNWLGVPYGLYGISVSVVSNNGCIGNSVSFANAVWGGWKLLKQEQNISKETTASIQLEDSLNINDFIKGIVDHVQIIGVKKNVPTMNDIFIKTISETS